MSAVDKLDVEELRTASARLREIRDALVAETKPPRQPLMWFAEDLIIGSTLTGGEADPMDHTLTRSEAAWLALITPELAEPLAAWLETEAARWHITNANLYESVTGAFSGFCSCGSSVTRPDRDTPAQCGRLSKALAVARVVNGGAR